MKTDQMQRSQAKTSEQRFMTILQQDFNYAPKIAQAILDEAQECLLGQKENLRPGQKSVILLKRGAPHGRSLNESKMVEVVWTIDSGTEDQEVISKYNAQVLRQVRIQRLLDEALAQGGVASQEDLAQALKVSARTIKRDCVALKEQGIYLPTRGNLQGIGRGQTHKAQIVGRWLKGETYDQVAQHTHHSVSSVRRYIQGFVRVINLHQQNFAQDEICLLLQNSAPLIKEYLAIYEQNDSDFCRKRLTEQLKRLNGKNHQAKKGVS